MILSILGTLSASPYVIWVTYVYVRLLNGGLKAEQWDPYVKNVFRILKPGTGWAQFAETNMVSWDDDSVPPDSDYAKVPFSLLLYLQAIALLDLASVRAGDLVFSRKLC